MKNRRKSRSQKNSVPSFSIVVPVTNRPEDVKTFVKRLYKDFSRFRAEVLFVDKKRDTKMVEAVENALELYGSSKFSVAIHNSRDQETRGGLAGAVIDGVERALFDKVVVMEADLHYSSVRLKEMLADSKQYDLVVASRFCEGGDVEKLESRLDKLALSMPSWLCKVLFPSRLRNISDPLSGWFLIDRKQVNLGLVRSAGFNALMEIISTHPGLTRVEIPHERDKSAFEKSIGGTHLFSQNMKLLFQLVQLKVFEARQVFVSSPKFFQFATVGGFVFLFGMVLLSGMVELLGIDPIVANAVQLFVTFGLNYQFNRYVTWGERDLKAHSVHKFLISRAFTSGLNYVLFLELYNRNLTYDVMGLSGAFTVGYLAANIITLSVVTVLNYFISDLWTFAEKKSLSKTAQAAGDKHHKLDLSNAVKPVPEYVESFYVDVKNKEKRITGTAKKLAKYSRRALFGILVFVVVCALIVGFIQQTSLTLAILLATIGLFLFVQSTVEVWRMVYIYRQPDAVDKIAFPRPRKLRERFCLIVPARHESEVLGATLEQLARQTHKDVHIVTVICDDDEETLKVAYDVAITHSMITVMQYPLREGEKPNKPKQLNYVYEQIKNEKYTVIGVIDAEDTVHPALLEHVDAAFTRDRVDIVQGGVQLMNHDSSWYSLHNVLEYYRWFNSAMTFQATHNFMPLGGNTIFIKNRILKKAGGWPETLTEDCSLGVLLSSRFKAKTAVYYEPWLATREETPDSLKGLFRQRVRWNQGFFQEWLKGVWRELPTLRQRVLASYVLMGPIILGTISVLMIVSLFAAVFLSAPVGLVLLMYLSLIPGVLLVVLNAVFLHDFGNAFERRVTIKHYAIVLFTSVLYQLVLNLAAFWAIIRHIRKEESWHKTAHSGLHREETVMAAAFEGVSE